MAKSQQTFNKSEKEKKRLKKREDKKKKMDARKAEAKEHGKKGIEFAYVDHFGNITDTPPDPTKKKKIIKASAIELGIPKKDDDEGPNVHTGKIDFYNDQKGFGFLAREDGVAGQDLDQAGREQELENLLDELHVSHVRTSLGISLSGGERRRVEIARALAANPLFVLLDEPFAGVDPISVLDIQRIIKHLSERDIGVLITDHNVRETLGICGRAYILSDGSLIASGSPEEILENHHVREVYLGQEFKL